MENKIKKLRTILLFRQPVHSRNGPEAGDADAALQIFSTVS